MEIIARNEEVKVSIITIVYNNLKGLKRTIESISKQTYTNIEFIVIDGASTDGTVDFIKANTNLITRYISEKDNGISDAFNKGLHNVTGDLVFFLNSGDTFINRDVVSEVVHEWNDNQVDVLFYKVQVSESVFIPSNSYKDNQKEIWEMSDVPHQGAFIKSSLFKKVGEFNIDYQIRMDFEFFARCKVKKCTYYFNPKIIVSYEPGGKSMMKSNRKKFWNEGMAVKYLYSIPLTYKDKIKTVLYK